MMCLAHNLHIWIVCRGWHVLANNLLQRRRLHIEVRAAATCVPSISKQQRAKVQLKAWLKGTTFLLRSALSLLIAWECTYYPQWGSPNMCVSCHFRKMRIAKEELHWHWSLVAWIFLTSDHSCNTKWLCTRYCCVKFKMLVSNVGPWESCCTLILFWSILPIRAIELSR